MAALGCALAGAFLERVWPQLKAVSFGLWLMGFAVYFKFVVKHGLWKTDSTTKKYQRKWSI